MGGRAMKRPALPFARLAALTFVVSGVASAHDFWIEPSTFRPAPGEAFTASLRVGQKLQGEPLPLIPFFVDRFVLKGRGPEVSIEGESRSGPAASCPSLFSSEESRPRTSSSWR